MKCFFQLNRGSRNASWVSILNFNVFCTLLYVFPTVSLSIDVCVFCVCLCVPLPWSVSQQELFGGTEVHPQMGCEAKRVQTAPGKANLSTNFHNNVFLHTWSNITAAKELSSGGQIISLLKHLFYCEWPEQWDEPVWSQVTTGFFPGQWGYEF